MTILPEFLLLFSSGLAIPTLVKSMPLASVLLTTVLSGIHSLWVKVSLHSSSQGNWGNFLSLPTGPQL